MYSRLLNVPPDQSFFLFGPRGTGKTTWAKTKFPNALYLDLLEAEIFNDLLAAPQRLENYVPNNFKGHIIIDEIQRVPELLNEVHRLIENKHYKFILTGSSARKLRKKGHNLLAGRAFTYFFHPLSVTELGLDFNLEHALKFGLLPTVLKNKNPQKYLESYVKTYLEEEISQEGLTRNLSGFARFLETASFSNGNVLNTAEVAREAMIERKIVQNYFKILEDLLIAVRIPVFSKKAKRRLIAHPKFYFFDTGIYRTLRPMGPLDSPEIAEGSALETLFLQNLIAVNDNLNLGLKVYFYRTSSQIEVDFVAYGSSGIFAFEIKRGSRLNSDVFRGLKLFQKEYPQAKCYLIYGGKRKMREGRINIIPFETAIFELEKLLS